jgi:hypothetical protein
MPTRTHTSIFVFWRPFFMKSAGEGDSIPGGGGPPQRHPGQV